MLIPIIMDPMTITMTWTEPNKATQEVKDPISAKTIIGNAFKRIHGLRMKMLTMEMTPIKESRFILTTSF